MTNYTDFIVLFLYTLLVITTAEYDPFMDSVWFKMAWPGPGKQAPTDLAGSIENDGKSDDNSIVMTTVNNEKYKCIIPDLKSKRNEEELKYKGADEITLLQPLFSQKSCSYRVETYWTYELCHGQFFRQYHEEKDASNKRTKIHEYYLGNYEKPESKETNPETTETENTQQTEKKKAIPVRKIEGIEMPYFKVNMSNGTPCDLSKKNRHVSLYYVCQPEGKGEIYDLKEISTCEYEAVVLTFLLCGHPDYQPKKKKVNEIQCHSVDGSPAHPESLTSLIRDSLDMQDHQKPAADVASAPHSPEDEEGAAPKSTVSFEERKPTSISIQADQELIRSFLSGDYCIVGGAGWWKHELCYGKHAKQFHETETGERTDIVLGLWNLETHKDWLLQHPNKLPKPLNKRKHVSQYYSGGDICDLTGKPRNVEVKLTCKEKTKQPHAISIYLLEPKTCEYVLVVESELMCGVIEKVDDSGIAVQPPS